jgi:hypothetical protein
MSYVHDRYCPAQLLPDDGCPFCLDLRKARDETRQQLNDTWQPILRDAELRGYDRGYRDGICGRPAAP